MHLPSPLAIWRTLALGSLAACAALWWAEPQAVVAEEEAGDSARTTELRAHASSTGRYVDRPQAGGRVAQLSAAVEQAPNAEARCAALMQLGRSRDVAQAQVEQLIHYAEPAERTDIRVCAISALGYTQFESALPVLIEFANDELLPIAEASLRALSDFDAREAGMAIAEVARGDHETLRLVAASVLADRRDPEAVPVIIEIFERCPLMTRDQLLYALGRTGDVRAVPFLRAQVHEGSRTLQYTAVAALGELGGSAAAQTLLSLVQTTPALAPAALQALGRTGDEDAREVLLDAANGKYGPQAFVPALQGLAGRESPEVTKLMLRALDDPNHGGVAVDYVASHGIVEAIPMLARLAREGGQGTMHNAVNALARLDHPDARALIAQLASTPGPASQVALTALAEQPGGKERVRAIALARIKEGGEAGQVALSVLSNDTSDAARAGLIEAARGADASLAQYAIHLLSQRPDSQNLQTLTDLASHGRTPELRATALSALSQTQGTKNQALFKQALTDESPQVRMQAVQALGENGHSPQLESDLLAASRDVDANVVNAAAVGLSQLGSERALSRLEELVTSGDPGSAPHTLQLLAGTQPARAGQFAEAMARSTDPQISLSAVQIAGMFGRPVAARILRSGLQNSDPNVLQMSLSMLAQFGLPKDELSSLLTPLLQNDQLPAEARAMIAQLLGTTS